MKRKTKLTKPASIENKLNLIRRIPCPYSAMFSICSDLDETPPGEFYFEMSRYLNTEENTSYGNGVGLEVGNTIYFDMAENQFSYWNAGEKDRDRVRQLIKSGHIDCLHSFGDLATSRDDAERALNELEKHNCKVEVWIDHGRAVTNFGPDIMKGEGDLIGSRAYHADLTVAYGIKYIWCGRVTSVVGQNARRSLKGIWNCGHPIASSRTCLKEGVKGLLARAGSSKYNMHGTNKVIKKVRLRDGQEVFEFIRSNPYWGGISEGDSSNEIAEIINERMLSLLKKREGIWILYTHLGKQRKKGESLGKPARKAMRLLADYFKRGKILVATTSRTLRYCRAMEGIKLSVKNEDQAVYIDIDYGGRDEDLQGLTFYTLAPMKTTIRINRQEVNRLQINPADKTGRPSVTIPWKRLEFPSI